MQMGENLLFENGIAALADPIFGGHVVADRIFDALERGVVTEGRRA